MKKINNALLTHLFHGIQIEHMIAKSKQTALLPFLTKACGTSVTELVHLLSSLFT